MSTYSLNGKYAIVTGAGSGIGHAVTKLLLSSGCSVMLADLKLRPEAQQTLDEYHSTPSSVTAVFQPTDVSDWKQLTSLWKAAIQCFGRVDIVASVAGIYEPPSSSFWNPPGISAKSGDPVDASNGQYKTFAVNQVAPIRLAQMAIDYWTQHRDIQGNFLVVASISAYLHSIETPLYMASKAALVSFVKSLGGLQDLFDIRISAVCPGPVLTPIFEPGWNKKLTADDIYLTPEECASVILRVIQEPHWGNGSIVETQRIGDKKASEVIVRDVHLEGLYPAKYGKPSERVIQSRQNLVKRIQETGMRD
ncbi:putative short chain dehydrogenase/ reductase [Phaeosphaeriaceae sp. PMI808]|nr:putative short chain dehydrogenase/ reductase [Phaeosphaeriaceae sp. PMI808]